MSTASILSAAPSSRGPTSRVAPAIVALAAALVAPPALAQDGDAVISGRVTDGADGSPIAFASVAIGDAASGEPLTGALADAEGRFHIEGLTPGRYLVSVTFPSFEVFETEVLVSELNVSYDLGEVRLIRLAFEEAITVTAEAVRAAGVDTQVFELAEAASQSTGSLLDAMRNLPGVTVDQEGKVLLRGSDRVAILIDGKQSSLTGFGSQRGLDSVSAANVAAIEVIHNPSASFDAAGMAGIINIIYKEEKKLGWSGDAGFSLGVGQLGKRRPDLPTELGSFSGNDKLIPSLNLAYSTESVRSFVQAELLLQDDLPNNEFTTRFYDDGRVLESQVPENREQSHWVVKAGADWSAGRGTTVSLSGIYDFETHTDRAQVPFILASTGERQRYWFWQEEEDTGFANVRLGLKHEFETPGHELDFDLQYTRGWEDEAYFLNEESALRVGTDATHLVAKEHTLPVSLDYKRPLSSGRLEVGSRLQWRWLPITYQVDRGEQSVIYEGLGDFSDWSEDLFAAYGNLVWIRSAYTLEAGVRVEQTDVSYTIPEDNVYYEGSDAYDYFEVFPNVKASFELFGENRLVAAYNRRIDRPGEPELRIFPKYDDPELLKVGNPFLRPQLTDVIEIGYARSWEGGSARAALYHRNIDDAFQRIFAIDGSNPSYDIVNKIYENAGNSTQNGIELVVDHQVVPAWRVAGSVHLFRNEIEAYETVLLFPTARPLSIAASTDDTWDLTVNNRFSLPGAGELQLSFLYYGERNVPQGRERARSSLDFAAKWPLMGERAELVVTVTDLFDDFAVEREVDGEGFTALYQNFKETRVATVGLRVRF